MIRRTLLAHMALWLFVSLPAFGGDGRQLAVHGSELHYSGPQTLEAARAEARSESQAILDAVRANPLIKTLVLSGPFPLMGYAEDVANAVEDLQLTTTIAGQCSDACIYIFVAGKARDLPVGAKIGMRRRVLPASYSREAYERDKETYGWQDEFGQAAMVYDLAQSNMRWMLLYLMRRGVSLDFGLKIFATPREDMWWATREELVAGGVIEK